MQQETLLRNIQLALVFTNGFLVSRLFLVQGLTEKLVYGLLVRTRGRIVPILLILVFVSAILSLFIPNVVTVLALLPVIESLRKVLIRNLEERKWISTALALTVIYGANIGGMGSLIGSPANLLLLGANAFLKPEGYEKITFLTWLIWGIPTMIVFAFIAGGVLVVGAVPSAAWREHFDFSIHPGEGTLSVRQRRTLILSIVSLVLWMVLSMGELAGPKFLFGCTVLGGVYLALFVALLFLPVSRRGPLLQFRDLFLEFPWKGFLWIGVAALILIVLKITGLLERGEELLDQFRGSPLPTLSAYPAYFILIAGTMLATGFLSNTLVSVSLFPVLNAIAPRVGMHPLAAMIGVAIASTCAFTTPVGTPVNALAFGGIENVSFRRMFGMGLVLILLGSLWIACILTWLIPWCYALTG